MQSEEIVKTRAAGACELCKAENAQNLYQVDGSSETNDQATILICDKCLAQIEKREEPDADHWTVLSETMWSDVAGVQIMAWRMLNRLRHLSWAAENLEILYLDEEHLAWAKTSLDHTDNLPVSVHKDSNGTPLQNGDTVVLTRTLDVKGSSLSAKLGTVVKNIRLVEDNAEQIEGKIEGQTIVILTRYLRKQGK